jgi:hypothetical protein
VRILVLGSLIRDRASDSMAEILALRHEVTIFPYSRAILPFNAGPLVPLNGVYRMALRVAKRSPSYLADLQLLRWIEGKRFDMVLILGVSIVPPEVVKALVDRTGALAIGWFPDAIVNIGDAAFVSAPYERVFFKDKVVTARFRDAFATDRYDFLAQGFDPELHRPVPDSLAPKDAAADVAIFGNSYGFRAQMMGHLLEQRDIKTIVYGTMSWNVDPRLKAVYRPPVEGKAKSAAMRVASIALNNVHYSELGGVNKRTFELGAMGAFQLVDAPAVGDYFEPGVECATFRGPKDLVDQVRRWLPLPAERAAIARRGLVRAFREHSYNHRLNEMFERIPALRGEPKLPVPVGPPEPDGELELTGGPCKKRLTVAEVSLTG